MKKFGISKHYSATEVVSLKNSKPKTKVRRGPFWRYGTSDYFENAPSYGEIVRVVKELHENQNWVKVTWKNGLTDFYRIGPNYFDLVIADENKVIVETM